MSEEAFIYEAIRTPRGKQRNGALNEVKPVNLIVGLIDEMRRRNPDLDENLISDVIMGVVSPVGDQGGDIARTAALVAKLPETTGGFQLNRFCASGLEAVNLAAQKVRSGWDDLVYAGGVESMSRVPMGSDGGAWAGDPETNYRIGFVPQGIGADLIATLDGYSREAVDEFGMRSHQKAAAASQAGLFNRSLVPMHDDLGIGILDHDEQEAVADVLGEVGEVPPLVDLPAHRVEGAVGVGRDRHELGPRVGLDPSLDLLGREGGVRALVGAEPGVLRLEPGDLEVELRRGLVHRGDLGREFGRAGALESHAQSSDLLVLLLGLCAETVQLVEEFVGSDLP